MYRILLADDEGIMLESLKKSIDTYIYYSADLGTLLGKRCCFSQGFYGNTAEKTGA